MLYNVYDELIHKIVQLLFYWLKGIVYALIKMKKYSRKKAWEQFEKGVFMTKREKAEVHESLLESASRISPEDRQRYEENLRHRMDLISHLSGLQNVIFWPLTSAVSRMSSFYLIRLQNLWIKKTTINWMEVQKIETINKGWLLENFFSISIFSIRFLTSMTFWLEFLLFMCTAQWLNSCT